MLVLVVTLLWSPAPWLRTYSVITVHWIESLGCGVPEVSSSMHVYGVKCQVSFVCRPPELFSNRCATRTTSTSGMYVQYSQILPVYSEYERRYILRVVEHRFKNVTNPQFFAATVHRNAPRSGRWGYLFP